MEAFFDASAALPVCVASQDAQAVCRRLVETYEPVVWWSTAVEIASGIARLAREGRLDPSEVSNARNRLVRTQSAWNEIEPSDEVRESAIDVLNRFPLRAADALQLAAALVWCRHRPRGRPFVCLDERLGEAAQQAGFTVLGL